MKSMIFAAGMGTRLKPLTDTMPKALVPVGGKPLLEHIILKLKRAGSDQIIINVHHFGNQIRAFLAQNNNFGIRIEISDEMDALLDTGGGIRKAAWFFEDDKPFLVHNVDILSNVDIADLYAQHIANQSLATLVVSKRDTFRYLLFDSENKLHGWINEKTGETKPYAGMEIAGFQKLAFAGIQVLSHQVFNLMPTDGKFPIMDFYLSHAHSQTIKSYVPMDFQMMDVGKLDVLNDAEEFIAKSIHL